VDAIADKKGEDILLLDIREVSPFTDYFVISSGNSERQLRALADGLDEDLKKNYQRRPLSVEGRPETGWVLIDYGDVIVHLFSADRRSYYNLEALWREGKVVVRMQ
jgi:ribosome-associated protein